MSINAKTDLTIGKPGRVLIKFAIPLLISTMFQQMYTIADSIIVGRCSVNGKDAVAALGSSYPVTMIFMAVALGMCTGAGVVISHHFGAKTPGKMKTAIYTSLVSALAISAVFTILGLIFSESILLLLGTQQSIFNDSAQYLNISGSEICPYS